MMSQIRKKIKKVKKKPKVFKQINYKKIINNFNFELTKNQSDIINEINQC